MGRWAEAVGLDSPVGIAILKSVLNKPDTLDRMFQALADPSRRSMVERLSRGPASVSELARPLAMSLPAVVQHLQVLDDGGERHGERAGELAHRGRPAAEALHHAPAARVGERLEHAIESVGFVKHRLKYCDPDRAVKTHSLRTATDLSAPDGGADGHLSL